MIPLMMVGASAEPPEYLPLDVATNTATAIVVATPLGVEFQALADGEVVKRTTDVNFWIEYRIERVLKGDLQPGQSIRAVSDVVGCEVNDVEIRREGDRFIERFAYSGTENELDPARWLSTRDGPSGMLFLGAGQPYIQLTVGVELGTSPADVARVEALVSRSQPARP